MGRRSDAKERLLKKTAELIPERGYTAVGVHELCEAADVKPGSFYYLYSSKQQLILDMLTQSWEDTKQAVLEPIAHSEANGLEKLSQFFLQTFKMQSEISQQKQVVLGCIFGNLGSEMAMQDASIQQKVQEIFAFYLSYFETWLNQAIESGLSNVSKERVRQTAESLLAYYEGVSLMARVYNEAEVIQKLSATVLAIAGAKS